MAKGRPPDPTRAKRGTGNRPKPGEAKPARQRLPVLVEATPVAVGEPYPPPAALPEEAHDVWRAVVADLGGAGHMRPSFLPQIHVYCEAVHAHAQATELLRRDGLMVPGANGGWVKHPAAGIQKDAAATILRFADALGLTPAARIRLALEEVAGMSLLATLDRAIQKGAS